MIFEEGENFEFRYKDDPSTQGIPVYDRETLNEMFEYAHTHNMQIAIHAIGDGILDWILDAYHSILTKWHLLKVRLLNPSISYCTASASAIISYILIIENHSQQSHSTKKETCSFLKN